MLLKQRQGEKELGNAVERWLSCPSRVITCRNIPPHPLRPLRCFPQVRGKLYELLTNCIPADLIIKTLLQALLRRLDDEMKVPGGGRRVERTSSMAAAIEGQASTAKQPLLMSPGSLADTPHCCSWVRAHAPCSTGEVAH